MATRKQRSQDRYDHILPFLDEVADQYYSGDRDKGFRHWAFATIFTVGHDIQDTDVIEATAIDGTDDFEIDGWYLPEADDDSVVNLFQSKHRVPGTTMGPAEIAAFLNAPNRIFNAEEVANCRNEETKELHEQLMRMLRSSPLGCSINLVWVTSGTLSPTSRKHAEEHSSWSITVEVDGNPIEVKVTLECLDIADLYQRHTTQQESDDITKKCDVEFQLEPGTYHETGTNTYRTLSMMAPVKLIIDAFRLHSFRIFRLNPRGPLGNKVNGEIKRTLLDPTDRQRFHLLNNGITAICLSWKLEVFNNKPKLIVRDFQIINGCQTTVTLWDARAVVQNDPNVMVTVKLIECPEHFSEQIASSTNTQAALKAEDFTSNEQVQIRLQKEFSSMNPPWFYQIKRGEWSKMLGGQYEKQKYRDPEGGYRKLTSKEVAQAVMAFAGFPGEAKDKIRDFLNKRTLPTIAREGSFSYERIYTESLTAKQLLLPAVIQRKVWKQVAEDKENEDWLEYARYSIVWLIGDILRDNYGMGYSYLFPAVRSETIAVEIDNWFKPIYDISVAAIRTARQAADTRGEYRGHREFFRTPSNYRAIESNLASALQMARTFGNPTAGLPVQ